MIGDECDEDVTEDECDENMTEDECDEDMTEDECDEDKVIYSTLENIEPDDSEDNIQENTKNQECINGVMSLLNQAVQDGLAVVLEDSCLDADVAYAKTVAFAKSASPGPTFRIQRPKKVEMPIAEKQEEGKETVGNEVVMVTDPKRGEKTKTKTNPRNRRKDPKENYLDVVPQATLRVDELAKLLG